MNGSYDGGFFSLAADVQTKYQRIINGSRVISYGVGGNAGDAIKAATGKSTEEPDRHSVILAFHDFLVKGANFNKDSPGAPVSYSLRYLYDSSAVRLALTTEYTQKQCTPKPVAPPPGTSYSLDYGSSTDTPTAGWTGSIFFRDLCSSGSVATGIEGRWAPGNAPSPGIPAIQLICRTLNADGSLGVVTKTPYRDGSNGGSPFSGSCSAANALVGMHGGNGSVIDHIDGRCAAIGGGGGETIGPWGGGGANNFNMDCQSGYVVTGIAGSYGQTMGRLSLICTRLKIQ